MRPILLIVIASLMACTAEIEREEITNTQDYTHLLTLPEPRSEVFIQTTHFWEEKIEKQPMGYIYLQKLAEEYTSNFERTGEMELLDKADSLYLLANSLVSERLKVSNFIALSSNAIKRHEFQKALNFANEAMNRTHEKFGPSLMVFDAAMELGNFELAKHMIHSTRNFESFDYLVRFSKYQDHLGNLDSAIVLMENAYQLVKGQNDATTHWAQANLADMYGHAGKIQKSYDHYLQVLEKDPEYAHALRGIAWIAYSHDNKAEEAREIAKALLPRKELPDFHLLLAELAAYENDLENKRFHEEAFLTEAEKSIYRDMYNGYLIDIYISKGDLNKAGWLALREVKNRPTPLSYASLAWVYELQGEQQEALRIIQDHVEGKSYEPVVLYTLGKIYSSNRMQTKAREFLLQAEEASFELGPIVSNEVQQLLNKL